MKVCTCGHSRYDHQHPQTGCLSCACPGWTDSDNPFWRKTPWGWLHYTAAGVRWVVRRAPSFKVNGPHIYWVYRNGLRYSPTGHFKDAVMFTDARVALRYVVDLIAREARANPR